VSQTKEAVPLYQPQVSLEQNPLRSGNRFTPQPFERPAPLSVHFVRPIVRNAVPQLSCLPIDDVSESAPEIRYLTRWRGLATMEELLTDTQVRKTAFAKARSIGYIDLDAEDCFQLGCLNLWQTLREQPTLLCDKGAAYQPHGLGRSGQRLLVRFGRTPNRS
jgi:hypothetical protein